MKNTEITDEQKKEIVKKYGWSTLWHEDNWVHRSMTNKDWCGVDIDSAYDSVINNRNNEGYKG
jgi:hypothetical protein